MAKSDVLILLDCCSSGVVHASDGDGITEVICACGYDAAANGVGPFSFTHELTTELRLLSIKPTFTVGALYSAVYTRMQSHMKQGVANERYPSPMHFVFAPEDSFHRSISLSVLKPDVVKPNVPIGDSTKLSCPQAKELHSAPSETLHTNKRRRIEDNKVASSTSPTHHSFVAVNTQDLETGGNFAPGSSPPRKRAVDDGLGGQMAIKGCDLKDSEHPHDAPRALFLVRFNEDIGPENLSTELFKDWMSSCPANVDEIRIEASYKCFSTLIFVTMPLTMQAYMLKHPAVMALGAVKSSITIPVLAKAEKYQAQKASTTETVAARNIKEDESSPRGFQENSTTEIPTWIKAEDEFSTKMALTPEAGELITLLRSSHQPSSKLAQSKLAAFVTQWKRLLQDDLEYEIGEDFYLDRYTKERDPPSAVPDEPEKTISRLSQGSTSRSKTTDSSVWPDDTSSNFWFDSGIDLTVAFDESGYFQNSRRSSIQYHPPNDPRPDSPSISTSRTKGHFPYHDDNAVGQLNPSETESTKSKSKEVSLYQPWMIDWPQITCQQTAMPTPPSSRPGDATLQVARKPTTDIQDDARIHPLYKDARPGADGLYHCPWENDPKSNCCHRPEKLKCNYE